MSTDDINEENFRARCAGACARYPDLPRLKNIAAVGVYDAVIGGDEKDSARLTRTLDYLLRSGFLIDPDFVIDPVNFRENRDFLMEDHPADLVFVSYIIAGDYPYLPKFWKEETHKRDKLDLCDMVSRRNCRAGWAHHLEEIGAKMVATYGGNIEVNAQIFNDDYGLDYAVLIPSPDEECMDRHIPAAKMKPLYPALPHIDVPLCWLGFSAHRPYLRAMMPSLNRRTCLGQEAHKQAQPPEPQPARPPRPPQFRL